MISFNSISILSLSLELNLKSYMDLLLIWGPIYPQNIILPTFYKNIYNNSKYDTKMRRYKIPHALYGGELHLQLTK